MVSLKEVMEFNTTSIAKASLASSQKLKIKFKEIKKPSPFTVNL
jgi:hypothetical protein